MMFKAQFLSQEDRERIHRDTLKVLWEVGIKFHSDKALDILRKNGAKIDGDSRVARIPEELVDAALASAPKSFTLGARNPEYDFPMPSSYSGYNLDGGGIYCIDFKTGERRLSLLQDNIDALRIFEELRLGIFAWSCSADDIPDGLSTVRLSIESMKYTSKHLQEELLYPEEVPFLIEALVAIHGSEEEVRRKKPYSVVYCTIPPLTHDKEMCEAYLELGQFHAPICLLPMNAPGTSGPASVYSTVAVSNAENLSSLVLFQMANPGSPIIYGDANLATDFRTGNFLAGAPEMVLQTGAMGEMARYYGLPNEQGGCLSDAKEPGAQAVMEKMLTTLPLVLSGVDIVQGLGAIDNSGTVALDQIVVDHEIALQCHRICNGVQVTDEQDFYADIAEHGPGGNFLGTEASLLACRSDDWYRTRLIDGLSYERWAEIGRPGLYTKARERVKEILASPLKNPLSDDQSGKLDDIIRRIEEMDSDKK
jgi:trimethylamine--corrinoid protein Co-methyltransferase